jgi:hypothetical protein
MSKRKSGFGNMTFNNGKPNATRTDTEEQGLKKFVSDLLNSERNKQAPSVDVEDVLADLHEEQEVEVSRGADGARRFHLKG